MARQRRARRGVGFPLLLVTAGLYLLLYNLGGISWHPLLALLNLWPIILVAGGLDLVLARASRVTALLVTLLMLGGLTSLAVLTEEHSLPPGRQTGDSEQIDIAGDGLESAAVRIRFSSGTVVLHPAAAGTSKLLQGSAQTGKRADLAVTESRDGSTTSLYLRNRFHGLVIGPITPIAAAKAHRLDLAVNPEVPIDLAVIGNGADLDLDLDGLQLQALEIDLTASEATLRLPVPTGELSCDLDLDLGTLGIVVPEGVPARIRVSSDLSSVAVDPRRFTRLSRRLWESEGYDSAENRLEIVIRSEIGAVRVR